MVYKYGDILNLANNSDAICCTTNGITKSNGDAVMGKGIAKLFDNKFHVSKKLGEKLRASGNHVYDLGNYMLPGRPVIATVLSFPTKNHWKDDSSLELIIQSAHELKNFMDSHPDVHKCYLPVPGCGCGNLSQADVLPELENILDDDRFICVILR